MTSRSAARPSRIALFQADGFPTVDAPPIPAATLAGALEGLPVDTFATAAALREALSPARHDTLILPYGSAFPLDAWEAIRAFVEGGGSLVVLGGAPFHQPVTWQPDPAAGPAGGRWMLGSRQTSFAHAFLIGPADQVVLPPAAADPAQSAPVSLAGWSVPLPRPSTAFALTVRFTTRPDLPGEEGAAGPRDAILRPLAHVMGADGQAVACPLLEIDRLRGPDAGARWVFAPSDAALPPAAIRAAVGRSMEGAVEIEARPVRAAIDPGDTPSIRVSVRRPAMRVGETAPSSARLVLRNDRDEQLASVDLPLSGPPESVTGVATVRAPDPLAPGLYRVEVAIPGVAWHPGSTTTGFWVRDARLLAAGPRLTVSRDWIRRDGKVFPIIGTTYMASDVHRKFLFEPNPHVWDRDFAAMRRHGINFVRTGLWTAWSRVMLDPGAIDESVLDALDAYVLTAARHDIVVCFTFFAFLPPAYGGSNPYLDPRALDGQRELLSRVGARYRGAGWVHFDLINEPSYAPPDKLWQCRPIRDRYERDAWRGWVAARHGTDPAALRERWRDASDDLLAVPPDDAFGHAMVRGDRSPRKVRDFIEFTQDVITRWAATLRDVLRASAGDVLVTLGQDEGGTSVRPAPQFHASAVDYTAVHTWWNNDDLLWDGLVTKVQEKPNLIQETGLMRLEDLDGAAWRTPETGARLLERKVAFAFASRGAGVVQWAWNINPYQPIDNEAVIGLIRPDGTAKPEVHALASAAAFFAQAAPFLDDFEPDPVVVVLPHSRLFSGRPGGFDAVKAVTRVLAERYGIAPSMVSELRLTADRLRRAKLVVVPVPEMLDDGAAQALLEASRAGVVVLVTGALEGTPYGETTGALRALGVTGDRAPVSLHERTSWVTPSGPAGWVTFDRGSGEWLRRSTRSGFGTAAANVLHEPLPLEFAREPDPLAALLGAALKAAGLAQDPHTDPISSRVLAGPRSALVVVVNETASAAIRRVIVDGRVFSIPVPAGCARLLVIDRGSGRVVAATAGDPVVPGR